MNKNPEYDAVVVGAGPNGFSAAITLARNGLKVALLEAKSRTGGGVRSEFLTGENIYDLCSAVHPLAIASPVFQSMPLEDFGLNWVFPEINLAHPFDDGTAAFLSSNLADLQFKFPDEHIFHKFFSAQLNNPDTLNFFFNPLKFSGSIFSYINLALNGIRSAENFSEKKIIDEKLRSLFIGIAAHSGAKLSSPFTAAVGILLLYLGLKSGWGFPAGGAQKLTEALMSYFLSLGGVIFTDFKVNKWDEIPSSKIVLFDLTPKQILKIMESRLPLLYKKELERYKYGPGSFKLDFVIEGEIPFTNTDVRKAGTVHLGGNYDEIISSEENAFRGIISEKPFVLLAQQSNIDRSRVEKNKNVVWSYCHVPNNSEEDMTKKIENQVERFAPGFKERIIYKKSTNARAMEDYNSNYIGGDINGGLFAWNQMLTRPAIKFNPYKIPVKGYYICSSATPPGGGVHGVSGFNAAVSALKDFKIFK